MRYVVVSNSEIRAKGIYNLVREYLIDLDGVYLVGKYDMDYLLNENLEYLFFDTLYFKEYRGKISKKNKILVKNPVLVVLEEDGDIECFPHIKVINGNTSIDDIKELLNVKEKREYVFQLTDRDKTILYLLSQGMTNKEIGKRLYLSEKTIKNNLTRIYKELRVENKYQAINMISKLDT